LFLVATYMGKTGRNRDGENKGREQGNTELPNLAVLGKLEAFPLPLVVLGRETIVELKVASKDDVCMQVNYSVIGSDGPSRAWT
jgi:hypothetical protein